MKISKIIDANDILHSQAVTLPSTNRTLNYIGEEADDALPITPNQFLNNRRSFCATPESAISLLTPTSTSTVLVESD